jgi:antitoxin component YwqK of YwqJK toxin-antitoxin module
MQLKGLVFSFIIGFACHAANSEKTLDPKNLLPTFENHDPAFSVQKETLFYQGKKFTGLQTEHFGNGAIYRETEYKNGIKDGIEKKYTLQGKVRSAWLFKNGVKDGEQNGWFEDGAKMFTYHYVNGLLEGEQTEWHENGVIFRQQNFLHGVESSRKILFSGGEIFTNYAKRDGRTYGVDGGDICFDKKKDGEK